MSTDRIAFRYFDCRGRAQALRDALVDAERPFADDRIQISKAWLEMKESPAAGPFGTLPVLEWGDDVVSETLPVAGYLSRRLGHYQGLDAMGVARLEMVASAAYLDVIFEFTMMIWFAPPSATASAAGDAEHFAKHEGRVQRKLERLERMLAARPEAYFGGREPAVADFFVLEAVDMGRLLFTTRFADVLEACPRLVQMIGALEQRPAFAKYIGSGGRPARLTGMPTEPEVRERLDRWAGASRG
jgi:glutathione S-transferase